MFKHTGKGQASSKGTVDTDFQAVINISEYLQKFTEIFGKFLAVLNFREMFNMPYL